jgi:hypothetical protein
MLAPSLIPKAFGFGLVYFFLSFRLIKKFAKKIELLVLSF